MDLKQNRDLYKSLRDRVLISLSLLFGVLIFGTVGYKLIGGSEYSLFDCLYMTVITVSTVGFEEVIDLHRHPGGRALTIFLIITGMGILLYAVSNFTAFIVEGDMVSVFRRRRMEKILSKIENHYIVCGVGRIGLHIVQELVRTGHPVVIIDMSEEQTSGFGEAFPDIAVLSGDAVDNDLLLAARIEKAHGLFVSTGHDKDNLVITMSARQLSRDIRIVTRCNEMKNFDKLKRAGANSVVSSNLIGGLRMASEMVRPTVVSFLDIMLRDQETNLRVEEVLIPEGSHMADRTVGEMQLHSVADVLLLAIKRDDTNWVYNPKDDFSLTAGMHLIIMGSPEDRLKVEHYLQKN
ncbi:MAG TPA: potassium channel protein [Pseudomonadales bacterium]|nr:potassium channel protein [Pseudomonadales bacterium]